ncbi:Gfo/Idh/MocA family protein [Cupriavidus sp. 2KB_3]|uniref:Gfo/Idh/MocA family protein n=1 Tax=Cupriavidus sp. 2KB_3 TaxID=3232980 RepID=UPI003F909C40
MTSQPIRVGIIGVHPDKGWATLAHIPALQLSADFKLTAISHRELDTAKAAANKFGVSLAFDTTDQLVNDQEVDLVVICVKVPEHRKLIEAALNAGKAVLCEWPLSTDLESAMAIRDLARAKCLPAAIGLQTRAAPAINFVRDLLVDGHIGRVISSSFIGSGIVWGNTLPQSFAYTLDPAVGGSMVNVVVGHTLDAMLTALRGKFADVSARVASVRKTIRIDETGQDVAMTAADQVAVSGLLDTGVFVNAHFRGGMSSATNFHWEINGDAGDIVVTSPVGYTGMGGFRVQAAQHGRPLADVEIPEAYSLGLEAGLTQSMALSYRRLASDLRDGTHLAPTFDDAVELHHLVDEIARTGKVAHRLVR